MTVKKIWIAAATVAGLAAAAGVLAWQRPDLLASLLSTSEPRAAAPSPGRASPAVRSANLRTVAATDSRRAVRQTPPPSPSGMECLLGPTKLRRKVVVTKSGVHFSERPGASPTTRAAPFFRQYFLFETNAGEPGSAKGWVSVGATGYRNSILGWLPSSAVAEWPTRLGATTLLDDGKRRLPELSIYEKREDLLELVRTGRTSASPVARALPRRKHVAMPWPILSVSREVVDDKTYEIVELLFLGQKDEPGVLDRKPAGGGYSETQVAAVRDGVRLCDVVFVVDNTMSTQPFLDAIRSTIAGMSRDLAMLEPNVRIAFGLVLYRDYVPGLLFAGNSVTWRRPLDPNVDSFVHSVSGLQTGGVPSVDWPEAVFDGLHDAIHSTKWRGEGLSQRVICLIGDNSGHEPGHRSNPNGYSIASLTRKAKDKGTHVTIHSLCIDGAGGPVEQALHQKQFRTLAEATGGTFCNLAQADVIVERIRQLVETQAAIVHERSKIVDAQLAGNLSELIERREVDPARVAQVAQFLRDYGGVELSKLKAGHVAVARGWALTALDGVPLLEKRVFVARAELDFLISELNGLSAILDPAIGTRARRWAFDSRIGEFFRARRPETLAMRWDALGVARGEHSLLNRSPGDFDNMSEADQAALREKLARQVIPRLINARNDNDTFHLLNDVEFGWILEALLP